MVTLFNKITAKGRGRVLQRKKLGPSDIVAGKKFLADALDKLARLYGVLPLPKAFLTGKKPKPSDKKAA